MFNLPAINTVTTLTRKIDIQIIMYFLQYKNMSSFFETNVLIQDFSLQVCAPLGKNVIVYCPSIQ